MREYYKPENGISMVGGIYLGRLLCFSPAKFPNIDEFGYFFPKGHKERFFIEATSISVFPVEKHIMSIVRWRMVMRKTLVQLGPKLPENSQSKKR
jgi:hypothetical protein